jgi:hypothetical protein
MKYVLWTLRACFAALATFLTALATTLTGDQNLGDLTTLQWVIIAGGVLAAFGGVFGLKNQPLP